MNAWGVGVWFLSLGLAWSADLTVAVDGVRSTNGILRVALFDQGRGFPREAARAVVRHAIPLARHPQGQPVVVVFRDLPVKRYAVSVQHDEDGDGKLTTNWLGLPREGVGVSNNPRNRFRAPTFGEASFELDGPRPIPVTLTYYFAKPALP